MENFWMILAIILYVSNCFSAYILFMLSDSMDDYFTVRNLLIALFWPITIWFLK